VPASLKLIVGLGNPGPEYTETRHNAGFWFVDRLAASHHANFTSDRKFHGDVARIKVDGTDCILLKPTTFMNNSGRAVQAVAAYFNILLEEMLIAHDEIDLETGTVRLKQGGGHGGHNGLRDIIAQTGQNGFLRLRIGVGHPGHSSKVHGHVLQRPTSEQKNILEDGIADALAIMPVVFKGELNKAMSKLHTAKSPATGTGEQDKK
jgi:PTH1 family peptidyl-tRNA hydrolase